MQLKRRKYPHYQQRDAMDCGPTSLKMVAEYYGKSLSLPYLRDHSHIDRQGVSLLGLAGAAEKVGFRTMAVRIDYDTLIEEAVFPCIAYWRQEHFVVVYGMKKGKVYVGDPANGLVRYTPEEFQKGWIAGRRAGQDEGIVLLLEPTPDFQDERFEGEEPSKASFSFLFRYLRPYKQLVGQVFLSLLLGSLLTLFMPFLTQALVDQGINQQNMEFIYILLLAQLMLFVGKVSIQALRSWILLHISARINIYLLSDFLAKLMRLPISFFDSKHLGDILQRLRDNDRIKNFLTSSSLTFVFSLANLLIFGVVLLIYSWEIFMIFLLGSAAYIGWVVFFLERRRELDYKNFNQQSANQSTEVQLVQGMQEIKLHNCEKQQRWGWEAIQVKLFKVSLSSLALQQYQNIGGGFLNELKNIIITFWAAKEVLDGEMTLGMMMAAQQILGQLNAPILEFITFAQEAQDAKISLERLGEIHDRPDEDSELSQSFLPPGNNDLVLENLYFRYGNPHADWVLENVNLTIPKGKTTAIVGSSGSGKTTLMKLLLKFYEPEKGEIKLGDVSLAQIGNEGWRTRVGTVMQDGFLFSDTIAKNIAIGQDEVDTSRLIHACEVANIRGFIESLPLNYNTMVGQNGVNVSQGQRQRLLIARAIYKNPDYVFFDEATSALDSKNEREITDKLAEATEDKTVVVIAHRLSTVKNADQIVVLDQGQVKEVGTHAELTQQQGLYYELIKNQLELGG